MRTPAGGIAAIPSESSRGTAEPAAADAGAPPAVSSSEGRATPDGSELHGVRDTSARAAASLDALQAAIARASEGMQSALAVNAGLTAELAEVKQLLDESVRAREALVARIEQLEKQLEDALREATRGRDFLIEEQDRFLAGLVEEHSLAVDELRQELDRARGERDDARNERDAARAARDEALVELDEARSKRDDATTGLQTSRGDRDIHTELTPRAPEVRRTAPGLGDSSPPPPVDVKTAETARPPNRTQPGVAPPPTGVTPPIDPSIESVDKLVAERERTRDVLKRLQTQRDEAQKALAEMSHERDELLRELQKLAPDRFKPARRPWSPHDARRTMPAIPNVVQRESVAGADTDADELGDSIGDRVTAPPSFDSLALVNASRPSPSEGTPTQGRPAEEPNLGVDGRPLLKRKPDPTRQALGGYSVRGDDSDGGGDEGPGRSSGSR